jgi:hypothetical protein
VVVWDGAGLGAGGFGGGVRDGLVFGVLDEGVGVGRAVGLVLGDGAAFWVPLPAAVLGACLLVLLTDGVAPARAAALACEPGPGLGDGLVAWAAVVAAV